MGSSWDKDIVQDCCTEPGIPAEKPLQVLPLRILDIRRISSFWTHYKNCKKIIPIWLAIKGCKRGAFILSIKYFCHDCMIGNKVFAVSFIIPLERGNRVQIKTSPICNMHGLNFPTFKASPFSFFMNIWLYPRLYFAERQQREVSPFSVRIVFPQRIHFNSSNRIHVSPSTFRTKKL